MRLFGAFLGVLKRVSTSEHGAGLPARARGPQGPGETSGRLAVKSAFGEFFGHRAPFRTTDEGRQALIARGAAGFVRRISADLVVFIRQGAPRLRGLVRRIFLSVVRSTALVRRR
jgi:hypothetical protein